MLPNSGPASADQAGRLRACLLGARQQLLQQSGPLWFTPGWHQPWLDRRQRASTKVRWRRRGWAAPAGAGRPLHRAAVAVAPTTKEQVETRAAGPQRHHRWRENGLQALAAETSRSSGSRPGFAVLQRRRLAARSTSSPPHENGAAPADHPPAAVAEQRPTNAVSATAQAHPIQDSSS